MNGNDTNRTRKETENQKKKAGGPLQKLLSLLGAVVCLIGLFYFVLMLTR